MATDDQITEVRQNANLEPDDAVYTDEYIGDLVDTYGILETSARIWQGKAARLAGLVDTTEGSSSRKMSQLHDNALDMMKHFYGLAGVGVEAAPETSNARVHKIRRS